MDDLRLNAVAARVVAWHNRHPLARRITAAQVKSVGYVGFGSTTAVAAAPPEPVPLAVPVPVPEPAVVVAAAGEAAAAAVDAAEVDYEKAFAALAEETAAAEAGPGDPDGAGAATPAPDTSVDATFAAAADPPADPGTALQAAADEAVATATAVAAEAVPEGAADAAAVPPDAGNDPAAAGAEADAAGAGAEVDLLAAAAEPAVVLPPASQIPTLRDRVMARAAPAGAAPAVQGAMLAAHDGYDAQTASAPAAAQSESGYGDNFMAPLSPAAVARWVARQGRALVQPPADGPLRMASAAGLPHAPAQGAVYVLTAAIDVGALRSRVLVGAGSPGAVLGARLWSVPRVAVATALGAVTLAGVAVALTWMLQQSASKAGVAAGHAAAAASAPAPAQAASAAAAAQDHPVPVSEPAAASRAAQGHTTSEATPGAAAASAPGDPPAPPAPVDAHGVAAAAADPHAAPVAGSPVAPAAAAPAPLASAAARPVAPPAASAKPAAGMPLVMTTERPVTAYAQKGRLDLPARGPSLSEEAKAAARQAVADARAAAGRAPAAANAAPDATAPEPGHGPATPPVAAPGAPAAAPAAAVRAALPSGPLFAVSTGTLRTRAEAEQVLAAMGALLKAQGASTVTLDLLPQGEDWRVVAMPFAGRAAADAARALLASRGMRVQVFEL